MNSKPIIDYTDEELIEIMRYQPASWTAEDYRNEIFRRSQDKNTKALNRWTFWIALATILNTILVFIQVVIFIVNLLKSNS